MLTGQVPHTTPHIHTATQNIHAKKLVEKERQQ